MPLKYLLNTKLECISLISRKKYKIYKMNHTSNSYFFAIISIFNFWITSLLKKLLFANLFNQLNKNT